MVQFRYETKGGTESAKGEKYPALDRVIHIGRATQIRREIGMIAHESLRKGLITHEAYKGYKEVEEGKEGHNLSDEMLESTRKFARDHEAGATRVYEKIRKEGVSEEEMDYLMDHWVRNNFDLAKNPSQVERIIEGKLERLLEYKKKMDEIYAHPLITEGGILEVNTGKKIKIHSKKELLKMKRSEQREFLDKVEESLKEAEKYAESQEKSDFKGMDLEYQGKLFVARRKKIIGRDTFHKFMNAFTAIKDRKEKQHWLDEFDDQMERYEVLWGQVRKTLRGAALKRMEAKLDTMGYTELLTAFGKEKEVENMRLNTAYAEKLEKYRYNPKTREGFIGASTILKFNEWMGMQQELSDKYDALSQLPDQMGRYRILRENVKKLNAEQQKYLTSNIGEWGYTEMKAEYERIKIGEAIPVNQKNNEAENIVNQVKDSRAREAIIETKNTLNQEGGKNKIRSVGVVLRRLFGGQRRDQFDAISFNDQVRERIEENKQKIVEEAKKTEMDNAAQEEAEAENNEIQFISSRFTEDPLYQYEVDEDDEWEEGINVLEASSESQVTAQTDVIQIETYDDENDEVHREAQFTLNTGDGAAGARRLVMEDGKHHYQSEASGGHDDVSLAFYANGETVEMNYKTIEIATAYFEEAANEKDDSNEKKAA